LFFPVVHGHVGARGGQGDGDGAAQAAAGASDQSDAIFRFLRNGSSPLLRITLYGTAH
jgi:hypothetical protein